MLGIINVMGPWRVLLAILSLIGLRIGNFSWIGDFWKYITKVFAKVDPSRFDWGWWWEYRVRGGVFIACFSLIFPHLGVNVGGFSCEWVQWKSENDGENGRKREVVKLGGDSAGNSVPAAKPKRQIFICVFDFSNPGFWNAKNRVVTRFFAQISFWFS